jgi:aminoglycoside phosphotransferase (APT) family kinase protein
MSTTRSSAGGPPETTEVRPGDELDWPRIDALVRDALQPPADPMEVRQFTTGAANLTYLLRYGTTELVLRRQPFGAIAPGAHDMGREFKVLSRLWRHYDRAPRAYLFCDDPAVAGADFFVMERRHGDVVIDTLPPSLASEENAATRVSLALVEAMADLHGLDPVACDLADLGRPEGFLARQVAGWKKRWDLVKGESGLGLMDELADQLAASLPPAQRVSIVHNDLKLDNCSFAPSQPDRVTSIFDWDMATLGDPLIDLGTLLNYWPDPSDPPTAHRTSRPGLLELGLPSRDQITAWYAERTGLSVVRAPWYEAFAQWKTAVVIVQLFRRWEAGDSRDLRHGDTFGTVETMAGTARDLLAHAGSAGGATGRSGRRRP